MNKVICFARGMIQSIRCLTIVSGHDYIEIYDNDDIQILKCKVCDKISIGFKGEKNEFGSTFYG